MASQSTSPKQMSKPQRSAGLSYFEDLGAEPIPQSDDKFDDIASFTLGPSVEGGYTVDHAGPTNRGITQYTFDRYRKSMGLKPADVKTIREDEVYDLYASEYFDQPKINTLPYKVAGVVFDYGVNSGTGRAIKDLQKIVGAKPDGDIGPKTRELVTSYVKKNGEDALAEEVINRRANFMSSLIKENPAKYKRFENGWKNRLNMLREKYTQAGRAIGNVTNAMNPFAVNEASADEGGIDSFSDLGAEPVENTQKESSDFSDLGAEPIPQEQIDIARSSTSIGKNIGEIAKGTVLGLQGIVRSTSGLIDMVGQNMKFDRNSDEYKVLKNMDGISDEDEKHIDRVNKVADKVSEWGKTSADFWKNASEKGRFAHDPEMFSGDFMSNPSWTRAASLVSEAVPSLGAATALSIATGSPYVGLAYIGAIEGEQTFTEARKAGTSLDKANALFAASAVGASLLEKMPLEHFLKGGQGKRLIDAGVGALQEGTEEGVQQLYSNILARLGYDKTRKLHEGIVESIIGGAGSGGVMGAVTSGRSKEIDKQIAQAVKEGVPPEAIEAVQEAVANTIVNNADEIEQTLTDLKSVKTDAPKIEPIDINMTQEMKDAPVSEESPVEVKTEAVKPAETVPVEPQQAIDEPKVETPQEPAKQVKNTPKEALKDESGAEYVIVGNNPDGSYKRRFIKTKPITTDYGNTFNTYSIGDVLEEDHPLDVITIEGQDKLEGVPEEDREYVITSINARSSVVLTARKKQSDENSKVNPSEEVKPTRPEDFATAEEYVASRMLPVPSIPTKQEGSRLSELNGLLQNIDANDFSDAARKWFRKEIVPYYKKKGINYIDAYHMTDASPEILKKEGIKGSSLDYVGRSSGNTRSSSVYLFLDPDDIYAGEQGVLGAKNTTNNIVHIKIPINKIEDMKWDSNFNLTFGTYSSARIKGYIPKGWITGFYSRPANTKTSVWKSQLTAEWEAAQKNKLRGSSGASVGSFTEEIAQGSATEQTGQVQIKPVPVIEMVKLSRLIMGEFPTLKRFPKAQGMFYGEGKGSIKLHPELFKAGNEKQLAATLAHEIGHLVDYLPDSTLKRGNVLGRLASLVHWLKTTLPRLESQSLDTIITAKDRRELRAQAERKVGPRPAADNESDLAAWKAEVSNEYADLLVGKMNERGLIANKDLREEMIRLSFEWRPIPDGETDPSYLEYRNSSKELYADAISALLNSPGYVKVKAPEFYNLFFEYIDRKPEFKKDYLFLQQVMQDKPEALAEIRLNDRRMMFAKGDAIREELQKEAENAKSDAYQNLRQLLDDRFFPITRKLNRQSRDGIVPSSEAVHLLREAGMWQSDAYKYTQNIDNDAIQPLLKSGVTTQDLGDYQYLRRVIGKSEIDKNTEIAKAINKANEEVINALRSQGYEIADNLKDREQLANPLGYTPESARQALDYLKSRLPAEQWDAIVEADKKFRDITFKIVQDAVDNGVYNKKVFDEIILPNKDTYASFGVIDYITENVAAGIKSSKGTLKEIENPFITTTLKTISLIKLIARNKAAKATIEELSALYPGDITESKRMFNAAGPTGYMKAPQGKGQVKYLVDGRLVSFDVDPYIAKSFENDDQQLLEVAAWWNKWSGNQIFRNLVITFNPAFQTFNSVRDFGRSFVNLNAILSSQGKSVSILGVLQAYYKALPASIKRNMGITDAQLDEMLKQKALGIPFNDFNVSDRDDGFARILRKYKVIGDSAEAKGIREKLVKGWLQFDSAVRFVGNVIETLPKVAGYNVLKEKGVSDRELGYLTRTYLGTPDTQTTGKWTKLTNQIFTFSNVTIQGAKSDIRLAINPTTRAGWHLANFKISVLPMLAMAAAILGFMGKELEDWFEKVPEFDKTNYIIVPLGEDDDGRARYLRIPHNQTSRIMTAIIYKMLTAHKNKVDGFGGAIDITASQLPSLAPALTTFGAWGAFLQGQNPYDMFRGRPILSETAYKAGGQPAVEKMVQFTLNNYGFSQFTTYDDRRNTTFETAMQATPFLSAVTRIVKTTDYGLVEKARAISREAEKETANRTIERWKLFDQTLKGLNASEINGILDTEGNFNKGSNLKNKLRDITDKLYDGNADKEDYRTTEKAFIRYALKEYSNPWITGYLSAPSNEIKINVLKQAKDSLSLQRYIEVIGKLKRAGILSKEVERSIGKD